VSKHGRIVLVAFLLVGSIAWASHERPGSEIEEQYVPGPQVFSQKQTVEKGPIDLPKPKTPPGKIPAPTLSSDTSSFKMPGTIGAGALPGTRGSGSADPVTVTERELKKLIRRLD
jgi:hypothetical protein